MTKNGSGSLCVDSSTVTWRSCIASSSADCVRGVARLISSTRRRFANTGPARKSKRCVCGSKIETPVMSDGTRSGVHCTRRNSSASVRATARASVVFPTPGTSSRSTWPSTSSAAKSCSIAARLPMTTRPTCSTRRAAASRTLTPRSLRRPGRLRSRGPSARRGKAAPRSRAARGDRFERAAAAARARADRAGGDEREGQGDERRHHMERETHGLEGAQHDRAERTLHEEDEREGEEHAERDGAAVHRGHRDREHHDGEEINEPPARLTGVPLAAARDEAGGDTVRDQDDREEQREKTDGPRRAQRQALRHDGLVGVADVQRARCVERECGVHLRSLETPSKTPYP